MLYYCIYVYVYVDTHDPIYLYYANCRYNIWVCMCDFVPLIALKDKDEVVFCDESGLL